MMKVENNNNQNSQQNPFESEEIREYFECGCNCEVLALTAWKWNEEIEPDIFLSMYQYGARRSTKTDLTLEECQKYSHELELFLACFIGEDFKEKEKIDTAPENINEDKMRLIWLCIRDIMEYGTPYLDSVSLSPKTAKRLAESLTRLSQMKVKEENAKQTVSGYSSLQVPEGTLMYLDGQRYVSTSVYPSGNGFNVTWELQN